MSFLGSTATAKIRTGNRCAGLVSVAFLILFAAPVSLTQQASSTERVYNYAQVEIEKALQQLKAYDTERLPTLEGFANASAASVDHLQNPHFQLHVELISQGALQTVVRVAAKITAWNENADPSRSQYAVVPSNGRLEEDLLDRLSMYLEKGAAGQPMASLPSAPARSTTGSYAPSSRRAGAGSGTGSPPAAARPEVAVPANPTDASAADLASRIASTRAEREALEQSERKLEHQISELQNASANETFVKNIAIVRSTQTPVFEQNSEISKILFRADPDDEFPIIESHDSWVRIRLENGDAWLRASQLKRPGQADSDDDTTAATNFRSDNQEIKPFEGDWTQLKGKMALFVFATPVRSIPESTLGQNQLQFAQHVFLDGYRVATHSQQELEGVVVVFLGSKGGVAAAKLADIRRWHEGLLTDKLFLSRCSLDPPESFRDSARR
jgi:hypothetical protein